MVVFIKSKTNTFYRYLLGCFVLFFLFLSCVLSYVFLSHVFLRCFIFNTVTKLPSQRSQLRIKEAERRRTYIEVRLIGVERAIEANRHQASASVIEKKCQDWFIFKNQKQKQHMSAMKEGPTSVMLHETAGVSRIQLETSLLIETRDPLPPWKVREDSSNHCTEVRDLRLRPVSQTYVQSSRTTSSSFCSHPFFHDALSLFL